MSDALMPGGSRSGSQTAPHADRLFEYMQRRERQSLAKTLLLAAIALPGLLLDALILSPIVMPFGPLQHHIRWLWVFLCCVPAGAMLFWWIDRHTSEPDALADAIWGAGLTSPGGSPLMTSHGMGFGNSKGDMPILTAVLLFGPRRLRQAMKRLRATLLFRRQTRERAAQVLRQMSAVDHSSAVHALLHASEQIQNLSPALAYLVFYDWIGTTQDTQHVWLSEETRSILRRVTQGG